jgi:hypothetical protein
VRSLYALNMRIGNCVGISWSIKYVPSRPVSKFNIERLSKFAVIMSRHVLSPESLNPEGGQVGRLGTNGIYTAML